jgi:bifunctional non-homologous end joining protein LigD
MATFDCVNLFYQNDGSDKEYHIQIVSDQLQDGTTVFKVNTTWGRRGSALTPGNLGLFNAIDKARKVFNKKQGEQRGKGYQTPEELGTTMSEIYNLTDIHLLQHGFTTPTPSAPEQHALPQQNMTTVIVKRKILWDNPDPTPVPDGAVLCGHPAPDHVNGTLLPNGKVQTNIHSQLLNEIIDEAGYEKYLAWSEDDWGLQEKIDGKKIVVTWDGGNVSTTNKKGELIASSPSFIKELKKALAGKPSMLIDGEQIGTNYFVYDILEYDGSDMRGMTYERRYDRLCNLFPWTNPEQISGIIRVPLYTGAQKREMFEQFKALNKEGVVFKRLASKFTAGKSHTDMWKWKWTATCSCRVANRATGKHSVGLELLDMDIGALATWRDVGNCTIGQNTPLPPVHSVIEVKYLYAFRHGCLYQPRYIGPRDDIDEEECRTTQLKYKAGT